jgi:esterase/lipase/1-acyl-sn-glycerol-3-phosphate acyltransferase
MNRSAYLTTGLAIKAFSNLSKANVAVHGEENIPQEPTIFVMNHFTRVETLLLPYYIYSLTGKPAWSLAASSLFKGGLEKFFDLVGVVSTKDPKRDELIVKSLLTGEAHWIIFPEGSMVKTKKIVSGGKYMIAAPRGMHEPHTGAAALALRAELFRTHLIQTESRSPEDVQPMLAALGMSSFADIVTAPTNVVPVNLTYYPIRAAENIASTIASRLVKDIPERMVEEIMAEGTMLLSGVDLDIRFGQPIKIEKYLDSSWLNTYMKTEGINGFSVSAGLKAEMKHSAYRIMQRYMGDIYAMTTVNHEHLFASLLRMHPFRRITTKDFCRRVFYAASHISDGKEELGKIFLHKSLQENQAHLLTDDRFAKFQNFIKLAEEKKVVEKSGHYLFRVRHKLSAPLSFHKGRVDNPIEVMANEIEPLSKLQFFLRKIALKPMVVLRGSLIRYILNQQKQSYQTACKLFVDGKNGSKQYAGDPFFLPAYRFERGVLLVHSYLSIPQEVKALANYLWRRGVWVYGVRLPGHGSSAEDLAQREYHQWVEAIEMGYILLSLICKKVVAGGIGVGGSLSLNLAMQVAELGGVFAICPPLTLKNYSTSFMPGQDALKRLLSALKRGEKKSRFLDFSHGNSYVNYPQNPVKSIMEVGRFLESIEKRYQEIRQPSLILQANNNPVVAPEGSKDLYDLLGSAEKEFCVMSYDRHIVVDGEGAQKVFARVWQFVREV